MRKGNRKKAGAFVSRILQLREQALIGLVEMTKLWYARWFKKRREAWRQNRQSLLAFPSKSLGNDLGKFLQREGLELMPKLEDHDVMHVLLHFQTTVADEARMQFFLLGNGKKSIYALFTAMVSVVIIPEKIKAFYKSFFYGRSCRNISYWKFEHLLAEPTSVLRKIIQNKGLGVEAPLIF